MAEKPEDLIKQYKFRKPLPFKHQVKALLKALELDKSIGLFMVPGSGKTRVAIDFCGIKAEQGYVTKVLIICPKVAIPVWEDQIEEYLPRRIDREVIQLSKDEVGSIEDRIQKLREVKEANKKSARLTFVIVNYDVIYNMKGPFNSWQPDVIVADELHFIKHHNSDRSRAVHSLGARARWKLGLTGTPITNSPFDLFSQFKFLDTSIFGTRWTDFKYRYGVWGGFSGFTLRRYKNLEELSDKAGKITFETGRDELDLPPVMSQIIRVKPTKKTLKHYNKMEKDFILKFKNGEISNAKIILTQIMRLAQISGGFVRVQPDPIENPQIKEDKQIGSEKLDALKGLLESHVIASEEKVVIFARFKWEQRMIYELCEKMKIEAHLDDGDPVMRKRFLNNPELKVFIIPLAKGGIAVNEMVAARIGIFYSLDTSSDHITQAMGRLDRTGQTRNVLFQFLLMEDTIDQDIYNSFIGNKDLAEMIATRWKEVN